jgi:tetratricopeptide (TPR) repeat protein
MSSIPSEIPGFGSAQAAPRQNPAFTPGADFTTEDYFVFSRCDGHVSARDIILMVGLGNARGCAILGKLRQMGAVLLPGETAAAAAASLAAGTAADVPAASPTGTLRGRPLPKPSIAPAEPLRESTRDLERVIVLGTLSAEEAAAMAEDVQLSERERQRIIELVRLTGRGTLYDLLGVLPTAEKKDLKRAYFKLSKEFHPDRYYNRRLGSFGPWLTLIFESVTRAYEVLNDDRQRGAYAAHQRGETQSGPPPAAQSRAEHAAELFDRACGHEHRGELAEAVKLFAAAVRVDGQPRYLRRAALCCMAAGELALAEGFARKSTELRGADPAYARVLAEVLRAAGKLVEAEKTLLSALELRTENDVLQAELRADLAAVRAARTSTG